MPLQPAENQFHIEINADAFSGKLQTTADALNSELKPITLSPPKNRGGVSAEDLRSIIERVEQLEKEKAAIMDDIKEVFAEAKGNGFNTKCIKRIIKIRSTPKHELQEEQDFLDIYMKALDMLPLFERLE